MPVVNPLVSLGSDSASLVTSRFVNLIFGTLDAALEPHLFFAKFVERALICRAVLVSEVQPRCVHGKRTKVILRTSSFQSAFIFSLVIPFVCIFLNEAPLSIGFRRKTTVICFLSSLFSGRGVPRLFAMESPRFAHPAKILVSHSRLLCSPFLFLSLFFLLLSFFYGQTLLHSFYFSVSGESESGVSFMLQKQVDNDPKKEKNTRCWHLPSRLLHLVYLFVALGNYSLVLRCIRDGSNNNSRA